MLSAQAWRGGRPPYQACPQSLRRSEFLLLNLLFLNRFGVGGERRLPRWGEQAYEVGLRALSRRFLGLLLLAFRLPPPHPVCVTHDCLHSRDDDDRQGEATRVWHPAPHPRLDYRARECVCRGAAATPIPDRAEACATVRRLCAFFADRRGST